MLIGYFRNCIARTWNKQIKSCNWRLFVTIIGIVIEITQNSEGIEA